MKVDKYYYEMIDVLYKIYLKEGKWDLLMICGTIGEFWVPFVVVNVKYVRSTSKFNIHSAHVKPEEHRCFCNTMLAHTLKRMYSVSVYALDNKVRLGEN